MTVGQLIDLLAQHRHVLNAMPSYYGLDVSYNSEEAMNIRGRQLAMDAAKVPLEFRGKVSTTDNVKQPNLDNVKQPTTGRTSCKEPRLSGPNLESQLEIDAGRKARMECKEPNIQALPRTMKGILEGPQGVIHQADFSALEARVWAALLEGAD